MRSATEPIGGVPIRSANKLWWPDEGITKGDVARFYDAMDDRMRPWLAGRPLVAERCPEGMLGSCFFEKNFVRGMPAELPRVSIEARTAHRTIRYVVGGPKATLLWLVNVGCMAIHTMNCRVGGPDTPDWLAFDLDPSSGAFEHAARVGLVLRGALDELGVRSYPKTSGARGLHVFVPLRRGPDQNDVRAFARRVSATVADRVPELATMQTARSERSGRVYLDTTRNAFAQTIVAPFSVRRRPHAPVSTPLAWNEVRPDLDPAVFNMRTLERRLAAADPWADFWQHPQTLPVPEEGRHES